MSIMQPMLRARWGVGCMQGVQARVAAWREVRVTIDHPSLKFKRIVVRVVVFGGKRRSVAVFVLRNCVILNQG